MPSPDGPWETANVLADGPSVPEVQEGDLLPGPVIALNCAIRMEPWVPVDVWCNVDSPDKLWAAVNGHFQDHMDILTTANNLLAWDKLGVDMDRILAVEPIYLEKDGVQVVDEPSGRKVLMPSMIFALAYLFKYRECRHVRVFGADMKGVNGPLHPYLPFSPENDTAHHWRWFAERVAFARAIRLFRAEGRRLERHFVDHPPRQRYAPEQPLPREEIAHGQGKERRS